MCQPLKESKHPSDFGDHKHCDSGDIYGFSVSLNDQVIKVS